MDVLELPKAPADACAISANLGCLVDSLGTPELQPRLFSTVAAATGAAHVSAFLFHAGERPRILAASTRHSAGAAQHCAERYCDTYWPMDPTLRLGQDGPGLTLVRSRPDDIDHAAYRTECYSNVRLIERVSAVSRTQGQTVRLHVYRSSRDGCFDDVAIRSLAMHATIITSLLLQQEKARPAPSTQIRERLLRLTPPMPRREREVCEGIATGMTSEAIGLGLGIGLNTVLSYRKRAYARLGITSQTELMHRLFGLTHDRSS